MSYEINGDLATYLGEGDYHDPAFDAFERSMQVELYDHQVEGLCAHELRIYPTVALQDSYKTNNPAIYSAVVALAFLLTAVGVNHSTSFLHFSLNYLATRRHQPMRSPLITNSLLYCFVTDLLVRVR